MKKIKLHLQNEDVQTAMVISGFLIVFALLAIFFF